MNMGAIYLVAVAVATPAGRAPVQPKFAFTDIAKGKDTVAVTIKDQRAVFTVTNSDPSGE
jgi:hypothetical protein